jgi:putative heme iron utilization protein
MGLASEALQFLRTTQSGVLSTFSTKFPGYPFGSVAPFVLDHSGQPVILISTIAEHTKNIIANPKVSLMAFAGDDDLQANARLTIIGEALKIDKEGNMQSEGALAYANLRARYLRYFPQAASYFEMHDFHFYRIEIAQVRYIAGFGKMGWVEGNELSGDGLSENKLSADSPLAIQETSIIEHMNADHAESLIAYCQHFHGIKATHAQMLGIDADGFDVKVSMQTEIQAQSQTKVIRFNFDQPIHDAQSARLALVGMSKTVKL